jgi:hypothetical protein
MFKAKFRDYVCEGDSISCTVNGFDCLATIHQDDCSDAPDERQDGFWPSLDPNDAGYIGPKSKSTLARYMARAKKVMEAWENDEWHHVGVSVVISRNDIQLTGNFDHALWGIECNYPVGRRSTRNDYLLDVANELLPEALEDAESILSRLLEGWRAA